MNAAKRPIVGAVIQARLGSSRLPGKVLLPLAGKPLLGHVIQRLRQCRNLDRIVVATSTAPEDRRLLAFAAAEGVDGFAGSEDDVLARFLGAAARFKLDVVVRICSDSALIDWVYIDRMIDRVIKRGADYSICDETIPHACEGFEVVTTAALREVAATTHERAAHEHVTLFVRRHLDRFRVLYHPVAPSLRGQWRTSIDVAADLEFMRRLYDALYQPGRPIDLRRAIRWLRAHPEIQAVNRHVRQKDPDAETRRVLVLVGAEALDGRLPAAQLRRLAERHHVVPTVAGPVDAERLAPLAALGYRTVSVSGARGGWTKKAVLAAVATSQAQLVLVDEAAFDMAELRAAIGKRAQVHALPARAAEIDRLVREIFRQPVENER